MKLRLLQALSFCLVILILSPRAYSSFAILNVPLSAQAGATPGFVAKPAEGASVWWNPAGFATLDQSSGNFTVIDYLGGLHGTFCSYEGRLSRGGYALWVSWLGSPWIARRTTFTDPTGSQSGDFGYIVHVLGCAGAARLGRNLSFGVALKGIREEIDDDFYTAIFADIGTLVCLVRGTDLAGFSDIWLGGVTRNLRCISNPGGIESYRNFEIGTILSRPNDEMVCGFSLYFGPHGKREVRVGITGKLSPEFEMRVGYRRRIGRPSDSGYGFGLARGLSAGFAMTFSKISVAYTYENADPLDAIHRISFTIIVKD